MQRKRKDVGVNIGVRLSARERDSLGSDTVVTGA